MLQPEASPWPSPSPAAVIKASVAASVAHITNVSVPLDWRAEKYECLSSLHCDLDEPVLGGAFKVAANRSYEQAIKHDCKLVVYTANLGLPNSVQEAYAPPPGSEGCAFAFVLEGTRLVTVSPYSEPGVKVSSIRGFKTTNPSSCKAVHNGQAWPSYDEWCVQTCVTACPYSRCQCEGDKSLAKLEAAKDEPIIGKWAEINKWMDQGTDDPGPNEVPQWTAIEVPKDNLPWPLDITGQDVGPYRRNSRVPKLLPHLFFPPSVDVTVYIDAENAVVAPLLEVVESTLLKCNATFTAQTSPSRATKTMDEFDVIRYSGNSAEPEALDRQEWAYRADKAYMKAIKEHGGVGINAELLIRRHLNPTTRWLNIAWMRAYLRGSDRDQPAFSYAFDKSVLAPCRERMGEGMGYGPGHCGLGCGDGWVNLIASRKSTDCLGENTTEYCEGQPEGNCAVKPRPWWASGPPAWLCESGTLLEQRKQQLRMQPPKTKGGRAWAKLPEGSAAGGGERMTEWQENRRAEQAKAVWGGPVPAPVAVAPAADAMPTPYRPRDPLTCKGRSLSITDYWCIEICKGTSCPKHSCACDGEDPHVGPAV